MFKYPPLMVILYVMNIVEWIVSGFSSRKGRAEPESNRIVVTSDIDVGQQPNRDFGTKGRPGPLPFPRTVRFLIRNIAILGYVP